MLFSDKSVKEAYKLFDEIQVLLKSVSSCISTSNGDLAKHMDGNGKRLCELADEYAIFHEDRLIAGVCVPKSAPIYLDILDSFKSVVWNVRKILQEYFVELK
jgi:Na+/phosphate symporter